MRDQISNGEFPSFEDIIISSYSITTEELTNISQGMLGVSDIMIDDLFLVLDPVNGNSVGLREGILTSFHIATSDCVIPEPSTCILLLFGLVGIVTVKKKLINK